MTHVTQTALHPLGKCNANLKLPWPVRCSRWATVVRAGISFCPQHDPGRGQHDVTRRRAVAAELGLQRVVDEH